MSFCYVKLSIGREVSRKEWSIIDYIPLYYSPIGLGFAACAPKFFP
jgi:hypothetical protein